jgi:hypothetical protein
VEEEVDDAHEAPVPFGHQGVDRLVIVEEPRPGGLGDLSGERGRPRAAVEGVVAVPQREPGRVIAPRDRSYDELGH